MLPSALPTNGVIDLSHHNGNVDLQSARQDRILAVIQKATQGLAFKDPAFAGNCRKAADSGLLWGAYHFGMGGDGASQADFFLKTVQPAAGDLLVLDFEQNPQGATMTLDQARAFVTHLQQETGRWPGLYEGSLLKELPGAAKDPLLANCSFWLAQYGPTAVIPGLLVQMDHVAIHQWPARRRALSAAWGAAIAPNSTERRRNSPPSGPEPPRRFPESIRNSIHQNERLGCENDRVFPT